MQLIKKLLFLSLISFLSTGSFNVLAQADTSAVELEKHMKSFRNGVRIYSRCLRGTCTPEERVAARKAVLKDGAVLLTILYGSIMEVIAIGMWVKARQHNQQIASEIKTLKERQVLIDRAIEYGKAGLQLVTTIHKIDKRDPSARYTEQEINEVDKIIERMNAIKREPMADLEAINRLGQWKILSPPKDIENPFRKPPVPSSKVEGLD